MKCPQTFSEMHLLTKPNILKFRAFLSFDSHFYFNLHLCTIVFRFSSTFFIDISLALNIFNTAMSLKNSPVFIILYLLSFPHLENFCFQPPRRKIQNKSNLYLSFIVFLTKFGRNKES